MNGVEILNQTEIMKNTGSCWWIGLIFFGIMLIISAIETAITEDKSNLIIGIIIGLGFGIITGFIFSFFPTHKVPTGTYEYQVTISEEVGMTEFLDRYEIIKQEGKIYTVVKRGDK